MSAARTRKICSAKSSLSAKMIRLLLIPRTWLATSEAAPWQTAHPDLSLPKDVGVALVVLVDQPQDGVGDSMHDPDPDLKDLRLDLVEPVEIAEDKRMLWETLLFSDLWRNVGDIMLFDTTCS